MRSHAILDSFSRENKARKIHSLTTKISDIRFHRLLEVGCGSGFIVSYFSKLGYGKKGAFAVDISDERQIADDFNFQLVESTTLPFDVQFFDFIISNHVIEHVGNTQDQKIHLSEIYRCLEPDGILYFAVPNRWRLIEPHYKLPFLSWLPEKIASFYVRLFKLGSHYDCNPLSRREVVEHLKQTGFMFDDVTLDAISVVGSIEGGWLLKRLSALPKWFWRLFLPIMPTLIFVCRKPSD